MAVNTGASSSSLACSSSQLMLIDCSFVSFFVLVTSGVVHSPGYSPSLRYSYTAFMVRSIPVTTVN